MKRLFPLLFTCASSLISAQAFIHGATFINSFSNYNDLEKDYNQRTTTPALHQFSFLAASVSSNLRLKTSTTLHLFDGLSKIFEESGSLGKGITVGKVQVALTSGNRSSSSSIMQILADKSRSNAGTDSPSLAGLSEAVCLALLRKSDEWVGACSDFQWFSENDSGKAESQFNQWANREAAKFEKEYIPSPGSKEKTETTTIVVVSLIIEIQGDTTKFDGAGFSIGGTRDVLSSIASDCRVEQGYCLNAVEVFWTPSDRDEVLTRTDLVFDFPEIIDF